jgi:hypothetical protein
VTQPQHTKSATQSRAKTPTATTRGDPPKRPAYDTVGLLDIDDAADWYAAWWECPEQGDVLKPLLWDGVSRTKNRLRTVQVDGVPLTSLRWVDNFVWAARWETWGDSLASALNDAGLHPDENTDDEDDEDDEDDVHAVDDHGYSLFEISAAHALADDDDLESSGEAVADSEQWGQLSDHDDGMVVGGVIGEYSYVVSGPPPASAGTDVPAGATIAQFLAWLEEHHPGLYWLMEGVLLCDCTPHTLAWQAQVSESTISRYRATARKRYEAANVTWLGRGTLASSTGTSVPRNSRDGRHARGEASRAQIVDVIRFLTWTLEKPPTQREIMAHLGKSSKHHVERNLKILIQQGTVRLHANGRGYVVVESSDVAPHLSAKMAQ